METVMKFEGFMEKGMPSEAGKLLASNAEWRTPKDSKDGQEEITKMLVKKHQNNDLPSFIDKTTFQDIGGGRYQRTVKVKVLLFTLKAKQTFTVDPSSKLITKMHVEKI